MKPFSRKLRSDSMGGAGRVYLMEQALELKRKGYTVYEIAKKLAISNQRAKNLLDDAFAEAKKHISVVAEEAVLIQNLRIEKMFRSMEEKIERGDSRAIEVAIKLMERQSRLLGLDAPEKQETLITYNHLSDGELLDEARRLKLDVQMLDTGSANQMLLPGETKLPEVLEAEVVGIFNPKTSHDESGSETQAGEAAPGVQQEGTGAEQPECDSLSPERPD